MKWYPDEGSLNPSEKLLQAFDKESQASKWVEDNAPNGHYEGPDYDGNPVDVVGVEYYQLTGSGGKAKWCVIGR